MTLAEDHKHSRISINGSEDHWAWPIGGDQLGSIQWSIGHGKTETIPQNEQTSNRGGRPTRGRAKPRHVIRFLVRASSQPTLDYALLCEKRHRGAWVLVGRKRRGKESERGLSNVDETASYFLMFFLLCLHGPEAFCLIHRRIYESCWVWWDFWAYFVVRERHSSVSKRWVWLGLTLYMF